MLVRIERDEAIHDDGGPCLFMLHACNLCGATEPGWAAPAGGPFEQLPQQAKQPARRGTSNGNDRGGSEERRRRRAWLVATYRANVDLVMISLPYGPVAVEVERGTEGAEPACRCYRCGVLLTEATLTVDRIKPGCRGGTYARSNIRPSCQPCASLTGAILGNERKRAKTTRRNR